MLASSRYLDATNSGKSTAETFGHGSRMGTAREEVTARGHTVGDCEGVGGNPRCTVRLRTPHFVFFLSEFFLVGV